MFGPSKKQVKRAIAIVEDMVAKHEHSDDCLQAEIVEITYWPTPDIDRSYEQEIYTCSVTGEEVELL